MFIFGQKGVGAAARFTPQVVFLLRIVWHLDLSVLPWLLALLKIVLEMFLTAALWIKGKFWKQIKESMGVEWLN